MLMSHVKASTHKAKCIYMDISDLWAILWFLCF